METTPEHFANEEMERILKDMSYLLLQQKHMEDVLWTVVEETIGQLGWEDCVIYLLDDAEGVLRQMAVHGPKRLANRQILHPIVIPLDEGIVGS
ncbi:MAG: diguanylate cyclase, partial [Pseudomonadota bacterium]